MKYAFLIFLLASTITGIVLSCTATDDIQVQSVLIKLIKKEKGQRAGQVVIFQYWEDTKHAGIIYFEELAIGDTGNYIGMMQPAFVKR